MYIGSLWLEHEPRRDTALGSSLGRTFIQLVYFTIDSALVLRYYIAENLQAETANNNWPCSFTTHLVLHTLMFLRGYGAVSTPR